MTEPHIAICISGQLRRWRDIDPSFRTVLDGVTADIFIHGWDSPGGTSSYARFFPNTAVAGLLIDRTPKGRWCYDQSFPNRYPRLYSSFGADEVIDKEELASAFLARNVVLEAMPADFPSHRTIHGKTYPEHMLHAHDARRMFCLPMFYKIWAADQLRLQAEAERGKPYEAVMRVRSDVLFRDPEAIIAALNNPPEEDDQIMTAEVKQPDHFVNDIVAIGNSRSMTMYSSLWDYIEEYWDPERFESWPLERRTSEELLALHVKTTGLRAQSELPYTYIALSGIELNVEKTLSLLTADLDKRDETPREELAVRLLRDISASARIRNLSREDLDLLVRRAELSGWPEFLSGCDMTIGIIYDRLEQFGQSGDHLRKAHQRFMYRWPDASIEYARVLSKSQRMPEALSVLAFTSMHFPKNYFAWRNLGVYYRLVHELSMSLSCLQKADELTDRKNTSIIAQLLRTANALGDSGLQDNLSSRLEAIDPDNALLKS